jgi:adenylate kinase family enzyme
VKPKVKAYMVIGCPGSGKSWVCDQLEKLDKFEYCHHDLYIKMAGDTYVKEILKRAEKTDKPILCEAPFSISQLKEPLEKAGIDVIPVFIQELPHTIRTRYWQREKKDIPNGHLTRQNTYAQRAKEWGAFQGTSEEVLKHLKEAVGA